MDKIKTLNEKVVQNMDKISHINVDIKSNVDNAVAMLQEDMRAGNVELF